MPSTGITALFILLGIDLYSLRTYLLKPYSKERLTFVEHICYYRLSVASQCIYEFCSTFVEKYICYYNFSLPYPANTCSPAQD